MTLPKYLIYIGVVNILIVASRKKVSLRNFFSPKTDILHPAAEKMGHHTRQDMAMPALPGADGVAIQASAGRRFLETLRGFSHDAAQLDKSGEPFLDGGVADIIGVNGSFRDDAPADEPALLDGPSAD